jgi:hypothetical protein
MIATTTDSPLVDGEKMKMSTLSLVAVLATACDSEGAPAMTADPPPPAATLASREVQSGTTASVGTGCRFGVVVASREGVRVSVATEDLPHATLESRQQLSWGALMVACGGLYRAVAFKTGGIAVFEKEPVTPPAGAAAFRRDSLIVQLRGDASLSPKPAGVRDFVVRATGLSAQNGQYAAQLELEIYVSGKPPGTRTRKETVEVKVGDSVSTSRGKYKVLSIVPPSAELGIPGWVEIDSRPST